MSGPIHQLLAEDHRRIESLLALAAGSAEAINTVPYGEFRAALLRHMGMEEKILIPEGLRIRGGGPLAVAERIHLDHGALAALLVPPPTHEIIAAIQTILSGHNLLEEGKGGLYDTCEPSTTDETAKLLERLRAFPYPRLRPHVAGATVLDATRRALARAGYDWDDIVRRSGR